MSLYLFFSLFQLWAGLDGIHQKIFSTVEKLSLSNLSNGELINKYPVDGFLEFPFFTVKVNSEQCGPKRSNVRCRFVISGIWPRCTTLEQLLFQSSVETTLNIENMTNFGIRFDHELIFDRKVDRVCIFVQVEALDTGHKDSTSEWMTAPNVCQLKVFGRLKSEEVHSFLWANPRSEEYHLQVVLSKFRHCLVTLKVATRYLMALTLIHKSNKTRRQPFQTPSEEARIFLTVQLPQKWKRQVTPSNHKPISFAMVVKIAPSNFGELIVFMMR